MKNQEQKSNIDQPVVTSSFKVGSAVGVEWNTFDWVIAEIYEHKGKLRARLEHKLGKFQEYYPSGAKFSELTQKVLRSSEWVERLHQL